MNLLVIMKKQRRISFVWTGRVRLRLSRQSKHITQKLNDTKKELLLKEASENKKKKELFEARKKKMIDLEPPRDVNTWMC